MNLSARVAAFFRRTPAVVAPAAPAPFDGAIVVVSPEHVAALPKAPIVTPYAGRTPSVRRGKAGRFESLRPVSSVVPADLADMRALLADPNHVWEL